MTRQWRVGRKLGRTLYVDDQIVGMVDTPELAAEIVAAMNDRADERARALAPIKALRDDWLSRDKPGASWGAGELTAVIERIETQP